METGVEQLIRDLRLLSKSWKGSPLSFQVKGDIVDLREPPKVIAKELLKRRRLAADTITLDESAEALRIISARGRRTKNAPVAAAHEGLLNKVILT